MIGGAGRERPPPGRVEVRIREATVQDAKTLATINIQGFRRAFSGRVSADYLAAMDINGRADGLSRRMATKDLPHFYCFVAETGDGVLGFISIHGSRDEELDSDEIGEVGAIYVHPDNWGRGIGQALMKRGIEALGASGFSAATLWTLRDANQARRFYEAGGWRPDGAAQDLFLGTPTAIVRYRISLRCPADR